jgi:GT2 family glycosyltransferase
MASSSHPKVAIVILNWNGSSYLRRFLPSVLATTYPNLEIIVADNASTDDSVAFLQQTHPSVRVYTGSENLGFAKGYNFFLQQVEAEYYILLNSDVEVTPGWIEPVIELMEGHPAIAACQPKIHSFNKRDEFEYAGASGGWIDALGYPFSRGRLFDTLEKDEGQYDDAVPVFWASGAALFIRSKCFHEAGGFDPYFFAHQEEIDLCWRLQRMGYLIYVCPHSVVYHVGGGTLPAGSERKVYLNFRNNLIMMTKNSLTKELFWKIPLRFMLDGLSAWKQLLQGQPFYWKAVFMAHVSYFIWLFRIGRKAVVPYSPLKGYYMGSIVVQYFLKRRMIFSEIVRTK